MDFRIHIANAPIGSTPVPVLQTIKIIDDNGETQTFAHNELFDDRMLNLLLSSGILVRVNTVPNNNPFLTVANIGDLKGKVIMVDSIIVLLNKLSTQGPIDKSNNMLEKISEGLEQKTKVSFSVDDLISLYKANQDFIQYMKNNISVDLSEVGQSFLSPTADKSIIDKYKLSVRSKELWFMDEKINVSEVQNKPEDRLFIQIPEYVNLVTTGANALLSELPKLISPYKEEYAKYGNLPKERNPQILLRSPNYKNYVTEVNPSFDLKNVTGDPSNNDLPIQENEREFYEALCSLYDYTQKKQGEPENIGLSSVPYFPKLNNIFKDYIVNLISKALQINYSHTYFVPTSMDFDDDNNDDNDSASESDSNEVAGSYSFHSILEGGIEKGPNKAKQSATDIVLNYVDGNTGDVYSLCEAAVKLLRWGSRKPTKLKVSGASKYLSLDLFREETSSGNLGSMELQVIDGCALYPTGYKIQAAGNFADSDFIRSLGFIPEGFIIPVGLSTCKKYFSTGSDSLLQIVNISIIDIVYNLIHGIENPNDNVVGFKYNKSTKKIEVSENILESLNKELILTDVVSSVTTCTDASTEFYQSGAVKDIFFKYNAWNPTNCSVLFQINGYRNVRDLSVLNENMSTNEAELMSLVAEGFMPAACLTTNMFRQVLEVLLRVNNRYNQDLDMGIQTSFVDILNYYADAMLESNFNYGAFVSEESTTVPNKLEDMMAGGEHTTIKELNAFGSDTSDDELDDDDDEVYSDKDGEYDVSKLIENVGFGADACQIYITVMEANKQGDIDATTGKLKVVPVKKVVTAVHVTKDSNGNPKYIILGFADRKKYNLLSSKNPIPGLKNINIDSMPDLFPTMVQAMVDPNYDSDKYKFVSKTAILETVSRYKEFLSRR